MPIRAIVFDFDGVIVDSEPAHARSIELALNQLGMDFPYANDYSRFIGRGDKECFIEVAREQGRELETEDLATLKVHKERAFVECLAGGYIRPYDATLALIRNAATRHPLAVCSGSLRGSVVPALEHFNVASCFTTIVTASEALRNKPDPMPYLMAAEQLKVDPADCAAIEDSPTGIRSARAAGYGRVIGLCHSFPAEKLGEAHEVHVAAKDLSLARLMA